MSDEPTLAYTVHLKGRKYRAGTTAAMIGPNAAEIGEHAWAGGNAPKKAETPKQQAPEQETPDGGDLLGSPPAPTPSALPTGGPGDLPGDGEGEGEPAEASQPKKATGNRRGGSQG